MRRVIFIFLLVCASGRVMAQTPAPVATEPVAASESQNAKPETPNPKPETTLPDPKDPHSWLWLSKLTDFSDKDYRSAVEAVFADYELRLGRKLAPGPKRHVGLKVMTEVAGLTTPPGLVRAVVAALEARGYAAADLFIVDQSESKLHAAGFLPLNAVSGEGVFDGVQVIALERGRYYSLKWSYDSNAPAPDLLEQVADHEKYDWKIAPTSRQSLLPVPLLLDVDFWINLPVGVEYGDIGPAGALINATLWTCSNTQRFFQSPDIGAKAIAEIATVPEFARGWALSLLSLERFQCAGGPLFNSLYSDSEPLLLASPNPVMLDKLLWDRINLSRQSRDLPALDRPAYLDYASLPDTHLGDDNPKHVYMVRLP
jgi:hypothetical protein